MLTNYYDKLFDKKFKEKKKQKELNPEQFISMQEEEEKKLEKSEDD